MVADGISPKTAIRACWNPVLFKQSTGSLISFTRSALTHQMVGHDESPDDDGVIGKPPPAGWLRLAGEEQPIELSNRTLLCGSSLRTPLACRWKIIQNRYYKSKPLNSPLDQRHPADPAAISGRLHQALCRSKSGRLTESWSTNNGGKWTRMRRTSAANPNAGADGTVLADGRALLVYNHTRTALAAECFGSSNGKEWRAHWCSRINR